MVREITNKHCSFKNCTSILSYNNQTGVCKDHVGLCEIGSCNKVATHTTLCSSHYTRLKNTGTLIEPKDVESWRLTGTIMCNGDCGLEKAVTEFRTRERFGKTFYEKACKACQYKTSKKWQNLNKTRYAEVSRRAKYKRLYGEEGLVFLDSIDSGEATCEVCGKESTGPGSLHIDHDHQTGVVRGILCSSCNTALGLLHEDWYTVVELGSYLVKHSGFPQEVEDTILEIEEASKLSKK